MNTASSVSAMMSESKEWMQELADRGWSDERDGAIDNMIRALANKRGKEIEAYAAKRRQHGNKGPV